MKPDLKLITISDNIKMAKVLLTELVLEPRLNAIKWSRITKQTPNIKVGYPGQHLASLVTGITGERTGARGNDLRDGSEVKSCSRIDQLDSCSKCKAPVARLESECSECGCKDIDRKNDSKWLFTIRNENDLKLLTKQIRRIILILGDYPNFSAGDFETIRFQVFEIWPQNPRQKRFTEIMSNYYHKIYSEHKKANSDKTPAPKNFWPYQYQFYLCNPIQIFSYLVKNSLSKPEIVIEQFVEPGTDRSAVVSIGMPPEILKEEELDIIIKNCSQEELNESMKPRSTSISKRSILKLSKKDKIGLFEYISEAQRKYLDLRDTDKISNAKNAYNRRSYS